MEGLRCAVEVRGGSRESAVTSPEGFLDDSGKEAVFLSGDGADELGAIVGLNGDLGEIKSVSEEVLEAEADEPSGAECGKLLGIADEGGACDHVSDRVFVLGQDATQDEGVEVKDVVEVLGVHLPMPRALRCLQWAAISRFFRYFSLLGRISLRA